ncbi:hypothetical protein SAMN04487910_1832 [Aquimarina amphilecti]|uniref:Antitoxin component YwqK of the YwqJK toxin-antitoxin module n=1 Tax=Aquimarina amphilecti TaxID=1038014 RepID=A0A1H7MRN7_AQUAM|nr:hypothetical protein [Aquimarina amphilecti]SEL13960.1 hypothetical protein SAMN04487910_1832 [Aquimarina amphilecti]
MNKYIFIVLILCIQYINAQKGTDPCFQFIAKDSVRIHLDSAEQPITQDCAYFYRLAKVNPENLTIDGYFEDYYMDNSIAVKATMENGQLEGNAVVYFDNGNKLMEGNYENGKKVGIWKHWYKSGKPYITYNYEDNQVKILEYYTKRGKKKVENGFGSFKNDRGRRHAVVKGKVKSGLPDGIWTLKSKSNNRLIYKEEYNEGKFIKGEGYPLGALSKTTYSTIPYISLDGNIEVSKTISIEECKSCTKHMVGYKNVGYQSSQKGNDFYSYLGKTYTTNNKKGYSLCSFVISTTGTIQNIKIQNSSAVAIDETVDIKYLILNSGSWTPRILKDRMPKHGLNGISRKTVNAAIPTVVNFVIHYTDNGYFLYPEASTNITIGTKK